MMQPYFTHSVSLWWSFVFRLLSGGSRFSTQHMWDPAPRAGGEKPVALQLLLLLHRHLLHGGLRRRHPPHLALPAAGGHHDLRGSGGAASAGRDIWKRNSDPKRLASVLHRSG